MKNLNIHQLVNQLHKLCNALDNAHKTSNWDDEDEDWEDDDDDWEDRTQFHHKDPNWEKVSSINISPKIEKFNDLYLPNMGMGSNQAERLMVGVNKIVYRFYNDGDAISDGWEDYGQLICDNYPPLAPIICKLHNTLNPAEYSTLLHQMVAVVEKIPEEQMARMADNS